MLVISWAFSTLKLVKAEEMYQRALERYGFHFRTQDRPRSRRSLQLGKSVEEEKMYQWPMDVYGQH